MSGLIAIVGRPNVGKSALFNRIVGKRIAIVHDEPGVTRDRVSAEVEWSGRAFTLVDTGGIGLLRREKSTDVIIKAALDQVQLAIEAASVIVLVVNVQEGIVPLDQEVAMRLRKSGKPVLVAVNKVDTYLYRERRVSEFSELGFEKVFPGQRDPRRRYRAVDESCARALLPEPAALPADESPEASAPASSLMNRPSNLLGKKAKAKSSRRPSRKILGPAQTCHRRPPQRRQILHHQYAHAFRPRHRQPHSRHHARRRGCAL